MEDCTVSITGDDGRIYTLDVKASILFDAVHQAAQHGQCCGGIAAPASSGCGPGRGAGECGWSVFAGGGRDRLSKISR
jgi:hypothetical protein